MSTSSCLAWIVLISHSIAPSLSATQIKTLSKTEIGSNSGIFLELKVTQTDVDNTIEWTMYGPSNTWWGIAWGSHSNGDSLIYCNDGGLGVYDYVLAGTRDNQVYKDVQNWNIISNSVIGSERVITATRVFDTGDTNDLVWDFTANSMSFKSCEGSASQYTLQKHNNDWKGTVTFQSPTVSTPTTPPPPTVTNSGTATETRTLSKTEIGFSSGIFLEAIFTKDDSSMEWTMYGPSNTWWGIAWGSHDNGDALVYVNDGGLGVYDYYLGGERESNVYKDDQDWDIISNSVIGGERVIKATRAFDTGDSKDLVWDFTDSSKRFMSCVGDPNLYDLEKHDDDWKQTVSFEHWVATPPPVLVPKPTSSPTRRPSSVPSSQPTDRPTPYIPPDATVKMFAKTSIGADVAIQMKKYKNTEILEVEMYGPFGVWFGIAFDTHYGGESLLYTTGNDGLDIAGEDGSVDYLVEGKGDADIVKDIAQDWTVTELSQINGQQKVVAQRAFDTGDAGDGIINYADNSMTILVASCDSNAPSLQLAYHGSNTNEIIIDFTAGEEVTSSPTSPPTTAFPTATLTNKPTIYIPSDVTTRTFPLTEIGGSGIWIGIHMSNTDEIFTIQLYGPSNTWFGVAFGDHMDSWGLMYTTGYDGVDVAGREPDWTIKGKANSQITKDVQQDWNVLFNSEFNGLHHIVASRAFNTGDASDGVIDFNVNTMDIIVTYNIQQNSLQFGYHGADSSYSATIDFASGISATTTTTTTAATTTMVRQTHYIPGNSTIKTFPLQEIGYDSEIIVGMNMYKTEEIFEVELHGPIGKWFGIAFGSHSEGESLIYTSNYDGTETPGIEPDYYLKGIYSGAIGKDAIQNWNVTELSEVDGKQKIVAHRAFDTGDTDNDWIIDYSANTMDVLVAHAYTKTLEFADHQRYRWSVTIDFESGGTSVTTAPPVTTGDEDEDDNENADEMVFNLAEITDESGSSGIFVGVRMTKSSSTYELTLHGPANEWFGIIWEDHYGGDAFIWLNDGKPDYKCSGKESEHQIKDTIQSWTIVENVEEDGVRKVIATRSLDTADPEHDYAFDFNKKHQNLLLARSWDGTFTYPQYHGVANTWSIKLDFESGQIHKIETALTAFSTLNHAVFMLIGFGFLIPLGIALVRFKVVLLRFIAPYWIIPMSRTCFVLGTVVVLLGFIEQISNVKESKDSFNYHSYGGFGVFTIWMVCMVIYYMLYRDKDKDASLLFNGCVSICLVCIGFGQLGSGLVFCGAPFMYLFALILYVISYIGIYLCLELYLALNKAKMLLAQKNNSEMTLMKFMQSDVDPDSPESA